MRTSRYLQLYLHRYLPRNGSWARHEGSLSGHTELMRFWRRLGEESEVLAPRLEPGDVLVIRLQCVDSV